MTIIVLRTGLPCLLLWPFAVHPVENSLTLNDAQALYTPGSSVLFVDPTGNITLAEVLRHKSEIFAALRKYVMKKNTLNRLIYKN